MDQDETAAFSSPEGFSFLREKEVINGRYRVERKLGSGGMGEVFLATDLKLDRPVAVKTIRLAAITSEERLAEQKARFEREARTAAKVSNANLTAVYDVGEYRGLSYIVMEYVDGATLQKHLEERGRIPLEEAVSILGGICDGVAEAHAKRIIHRDLKPANIMIDSRGKVKITDFGLAKPEVEAGLTQSGFVAGTPHYVSPEQVRGQSADSRSDLWAVGLIFYEMLQGRRLFDGTSASDVVQKVLAFDPAGGALSLSGPYAFLEPVFARVISPDPARRVRDVAELRVLLRDALATRGKEGLVEPTQVLSPAPMPQPTSVGKTPNRRGALRSRALLGLAGLAVLAAAAYLLRPLLFRPDPLDPAAWGITPEERLNYEKINSAIVSYYRTRRAGEHYRNVEPVLSKFNALAREGVAHPQIDYYLGRCYFDKRDYAQAAIEFGKGEGEEPGIWRIRSLLRSNQVDQAEAALEDFKKLPGAKEYAADIEAAEKAVATLKKGALAFDAWLRIAHLEDDGIAGDLRIKTLESIAAEFPSPEVEVRLAECLLEEDPERALPHIRKALEADPGDRNALRLMYQYYYAKKDFPAALKYGEEIVKLHGADREIAYDMACISALAGDRKRALDWLGTALDLGWTDFGKVKADPDLETIRKEKEFERLLLRYDR